MAEWSNVLDSKSSDGATHPWVRIPPSPPEQIKTGSPAGARFYLFGRKRVGFEDQALPGLGSPNRHFAGAPRQPRAPRARDVCVIVRRAGHEDGRGRDSKIWPCRAPRPLAWALRIATLLALRASLARRGRATCASSFDELATRTEEGGIRRSGPVGRPGLWPGLSESPLCWRSTPASRAEGARRMRHLSTSWPRGRKRVGFEDLALSGAQAFGLGSPNRHFAGALRQPRAPRARDVCVIFRRAGHEDGRGRDSKIWPCRAPRPLAWALRIATLLAPCASLARRGRAACASSFGELATRTEEGGIRRPALASAGLSESPRCVIQTYAAHCRQAGHARAFE